MVVLDTNVLSEALRPRPLETVLDWMRRQPIEALFTITITEAELLLDVALLPEGRRRRALRTAIIRILDEKIAGRILPFDSTAARMFADIVALRRRAGRLISEADARIAAITRSRGATLATRNVGDFADCGIEPIDPWLWRGAQST